MQRRDERYSAPLDRRVAQHFRIVGAQRPFRLDPVLAIPAGKLPLIAGKQEAVGQQGMAA